LKASEIIYAHGHENVTSLNRMTLEVTKETHLTKRGDCIIALAADKGARDLSPEFKKIAKNEKARISITIEADGETEVVNACGHPQLSFTHPTDLVVRKSDYKCNRTLAIHADKAAVDLKETLVKKMQNPNQRVKVTLTVESIT
jgi:uncharacterized protein